MSFNYTVDRNNKIYTITKDEDISDELFICPKEEPPKEVSSPINDEQQIDDNMLSTEPYSNSSREKQQGIFPSNNKWGTQSQ